VTHPFVDEDPMDVHSDHELFDTAASALHTRAQLDELLLAALLEPGLAAGGCAALGRFMGGPLVVGQAALDRLTARSEGAA